MQTERSDLCSRHLPRHQHEISAGSSCGATRVTQRCQITQFFRKMARDAGLAALVATHTPSYLSLMVIESMQRAMGHAAWTRFFQIALSDSLLPFAWLRRNGSMMRCFFGSRGLEG